MPYLTHKILIVLVQESTTGAVLPTIFHQQVFGAMHNLSHASICVTQKLIAAKFIWRGTCK